MTGAYTKMPLLKHLIRIVLYPRVLDIPILPLMLPHSGCLLRHLREARWIIPTRGGPSSLQSHCLLLLLLGVDLLEDVLDVGERVVRGLFMVFVITEEGGVAVIALNVIIIYDPLLHRLCLHHHFRSSTLLFLHRSRLPRSRLPLRLCLCCHRLHAHLLNGFRGGRELAHVLELLAAALDLEVELLDVLLEGVLVEEQLTEGDRTLNRDQVTHILERLQ